VREEKERREGGEYWQSEKLKQEIPDGASY
jgi:hypothetical protein